MAGNAAVHTGIIGFLSKEHFRSLESLWPHAELSVANSDDGYWIRGFHEDILQDMEVKSAPMLRMYRFAEPYLYLPQNRVPERKLPHGLLWTPIQTAFRLKIPPRNENLFEVNGTISISLVASSEERKVAASIVDLASLRQYVDTEPQFLFETLDWCTIEGNKALLIGPKVLPIASERYWTSQGLYLPSGFDFEYSYLASILASEHQKSSGTYWFFRPDGSYFSIDTSVLIPLTRSSVKSTFALC